MAGISFKMDFFKANQVLGRAVSKIANRQQLSETLGEQLVSSTIRRFEDESGPDGKTWKKSGRADAQGGQTLSDSGRLKSSVNYEASPAAVAVGTNAEYAAIHQFGGEIRPKSAKALQFKVPGGGFRKVKKVTMPARPYIGINQDDIDEARQTIAGFLSGGFK
ncbi:phage virion morphogenesis protein [uncultured Desulfobacter sp.]|uniref:phage virion morphogenesis protein n=1 Tax=uncultured Desulfobacter sp. TaxID=240139 RepID=UPI002AAA7E9E|nr:phage virion morphogenesis protein [uncultured Desulfobacter sp.]